MKRILAALATVIGVLALTAVPASANTIDGSINCEAWHFNFTNFPQSQDVRLDVAITTTPIAQAEGALDTRVVQTNHHVSGTVSGVYEVPITTRVYLSVLWTLDGTKHSFETHTPIVCSPPESTTTTTLSPPITVPPEPPPVVTSIPTLPPSTSSTSSTTAPSTTSTTPGPTMPRTGPSNAGRDALGGGLIVLGGAALAFFTRRRSGNLT